MDLNHHLLPSGSIALIKLPHDLVDHSGLEPDVRSSVLEVSTITWPLKLERMDGLEPPTNRLVPAALSLSYIRNHDDKGSPFPASTELPSLPLFFRKWRAGMELNHRPSPLREPLFLWATRA